MKESFASVISQIFAILDFWSFGFSCPLPILGLSEKTQDLKSTNEKGYKFEFL